MAEMPTATVELKPDPELTALVDRLANLVGHLEGCVVRVLNLQPGDVIALESPTRVSEAAYIRLRKAVEQLWPNNKAVIFEDGMHVAAVMQEQTTKSPNVQPIIKAAVDIFSGHYADFEGQIKFPEWPSYCPKLKALADALHAAGYEWETLT